MQAFGSWVTNSTANYVFEYCCVSRLEKHRQEKSTWKIYIVACGVWKKDRIKDISQFQACGCLLMKRNPRLPKLW